MCWSECGADTHSALPAVQVELVLADGHHPDAFNQRVASIPGVNDQACLSKGALGHWSSVEDESTNTRYLFSSKNVC